MKLYNYSYNCGSNLKLPKHNPIKRHIVPSIFPPTKTHHLGVSHLLMLDSQDVSKPSHAYLFRAYLVKV